MGILIVGGFLTLAVGMAVGTFAAAQLGIHEAIGQLAGVALVATVAILVLKAREDKRRQPPPAPPAATVTAEAPATPEFAPEEPAAVVAADEEPAAAAAADDEPTAIEAAAGPATVGLANAVE